MYEAKGKTQTYNNICEVFGHFIHVYMNLIGHECDKS